jgi:hypothetical protein
MKKDRQPLAQRLVRLYPRRWRERYQIEMLALLEDTGLDWRRSANVLFGAAREWWAVLLRTPAGSSHWSMVFGPVIGAAVVSTAGTLTTLVLPRLIPWIGWVQISPLSVLPALQFMVIGRCYLSGVMRPFGFGGTNWKTGPIEMRWWRAAFYLGSVGWQWSLMTGNIDADLAPHALLRAWGSATFQVFTMMSLLQLSTPSYWEHLQRLKAAAEARIRAEVPRNPIGLS